MFFTISNFFSKTHARTAALCHDNKNINSSFLSIFAFTWGLYTILHFQYLVFNSPNAAPEPHFLSWIMLILALCVINYPRSRNLLIALTSIQFIEMTVQLPFPSNHSIIQFCLGIAFIGAAANLVTFKNNIKNWDRIFIQTGRYLLLLMYVFGIFHKINADFLNPSSSCAVTLWKTYPFPDFIQNGLWAHYLAIYATFIIEGFVLISLLFKKTRYYGVIAGVSFHIFLGFSSFAYYPAFSMLSIALHTLFLPINTFENFKASLLYKHFSKAKLLWPYLSLTLVGLLLYFSTEHNHYGLMAIFSVLAIPLLLFIVAFTKKENKTVPTKRPKSLFAMVLATLFFLNCIMPYMGLKTRQTLNMFSNLHLENGRSNHLILSNKPWPFEYLEGSVKIIELKIKDQPNVIVPTIQNELVYHDFLAFMNNHEGFIATYTRNDTLHKNITKADLKEDIASIVVPNILQKWFVFDGVNNMQPKPCK